MQKKDPPFINFVFTVSLFAALGAVLFWPAIVLYMFGAPTIFVVLAGVLWFFVAMCVFLVGAKTDYRGW